MLLGEGSDGKCTGGSTTYYLINNAIQYYSA